MQTLKLQLCFGECSPCEQSRLSATFQYTLDAAACYDVQSVVSALKVSVLGNVQMSFSRLAMLVICDRGVGAGQLPQANVGKVLR